MRYSDIYDFNNLYSAYLKARKQKRYRAEVLEFSYNLEENLFRLQNELITKTYTVGKYTSRTIFERKKREIVSLRFYHRVAQHALNTIIEEAFDKKMIYDSYACRLNKGTRAAVNRLSYFMGKENVNYFLKMDIKAYFASIDRERLKEIISRTIKDEDILWLINTIIDSSPVRGMPIGNLTSQLFANVYLHELDHYCKNVLSIKYYIRYMDDIIILSPNKAYLKAVLAEIEKFLNDSLALKLNDKTAIGRCRDGIEFVGYRVWRNYKMIKKQSINRMRRKLMAWKKGKIHNDRYMASLGSWMGHSVFTHSYKGVMRIALDSIHEMARRSANGF